MIILRYNILPFPTFPTWGKIDNLLEQVALGNATVSKYINEKVEALEKEKKLLLEANQLSMIDGLEDSEVFRIISIAANWNTLELDEKKAIVSQLIEAVNITDDSLVITWKKPFDVL